MSDIRTSKKVYVQKLGMAVSFFAFNLCLLVQGTAIYLGSTLDLSYMWISLSVLFGGNALGAVVHSAAQGLVDKAQAKTQQG